MSINLSNTTPAAPSGTINGSWQSDVSGNVSVNFPLGTSSKTTASSSSGTLTLDCTSNNSFLVTLHENVTTLNITNPPYDGAEIMILWQQNGTGGYTVSFGASILGGTAPSTSANTFSCQKFTYNLADTNWFAVAAGITGM